jgi:hypothetical protein
MCWTICPASTSAGSGAASSSERYYAYGKDRRTGNLPTDQLGSFLSQATVVLEPGQPKEYYRYAYANSSSWGFVAEALFFCQMMETDFTVDQMHLQQPNLEWALKFISQ